LRPWIAALANSALRSCRTRLATFTGLSVVHVGKAQGDLFRDLGAELKHFVSHVGDSARGFRFDQHALALPRAALLRDHMRQRLAEDLS
jgi:hypothetical protein